MQASDKVIKPPRTEQKLPGLLYIPLSMENQSSNNISDGQSKNPTSFIKLHLGEKK